MGTSYESNIEIPSISKIVSNDIEKPNCLETEETKKCRRDFCCPEVIPKRYVFVFLTFLASTLAWTLNSNLNFAIVYMVDRTNTTVTHAQSSNECNTNVSMLGHSEKKQEIPKGEFYWSPETEGIALGASFYGQMLGSLPAGRLAELYGGKRFLITTLLLASIITCLMPEAARFSVYVFIVCRFLMGALRASVNPTLFFLMSRWTPPSERSFSGSIIFAGYGFGVFVSFLVGGTLCASHFLGGWPSMFYVFGFCCLVWCFLGFIFLYETPHKHPTITTKELDFISKSMSKTKQKKIERVQWKSMFLSIPFWSLVAGYFGQTWIMATFVITPALYMGTILNFDSNKNGNLSCLPHLIKVLLACGSGYPLDWVMKKRYVSVEFVRKGCTVLNTAFCTVGIIGILFAGCDPLLNGIFFTIGGLATDFVIFGVVMNPLDIAPNLSGTVTGILNFSGTLTFCIIPALIGWLTRYERSMARWHYYFYWTLCITIVTTLIFIIFGTSDPQPWGCDEGEKMKDENVAKKEYN